MALATDSEDRRRMMRQKGISLSLKEIEELEKLAEEDCRSFSSMARKAMIEGMKVLKKKR